MISRFRFAAVAAVMLPAMCIGCSRGTTTPSEAKPAVNLDEFSTAIAQLGGQATVHIDLSGTNLTDDDLGRVVFPGNVSEINLSRTKVSDVGMEHLQRVPGLERLILSNTRISDAGIETLKGLPNLYYVELQNTLVSPQLQLEFSHQISSRRTARMAQKAAAAKGSVP